MDFLDLDFAEMSEIKQQRPAYDFAAVSFSKSNHSFVVYFNKHATRELGNYQYIKIYANAEYVVFSPIQKKDIHCYKISPNPAGSSSVNCNGLERYMLCGKTYKLHNTAKGFAIKLNDPIKNRKV